MERAALPAWSSLAEKAPRQTLYVAQETSCQADLKGNVSDRCICLFCGIHTFREMSKGLESMFSVIMYVLLCLGKL